MQFCFGVLCLGASKWAGERLGVWRGAEPGWWQEGGGPGAEGEGGREMPEVDAAAD